MLEFFTTERLIWIGGIYIVLCIVAYLIQGKFIFKPEKLPQDFEYKYEDLFEELFFDPEPNVRINALRFYQEEASRGLLIYFHGNTRSIKGWSKYAKDFTQHGYDVLMIDYRGFGKSVGKQTEDGIKNDAQYIYNKMRSKYGYVEEKNHHLWAFVRLRICDQTCLGQPPQNVDSGCAVLQFYAFDHPFPAVFARFLHPQIFHSYRCLDQIRQVPYLHYSWY